MTLPVPLPECVRVLSLGEEDGAPVHIALVRCTVYATMFAQRVPDGAILHWVNDHGHMFAALPMGAPEPNEQWDNEAPDMGTAWHDIEWATGERSSSATVSDLYLDDGSVLLTVITPAAQQEQNMSELGRPAVGAVIEAGKLVTS